MKADIFFVFSTIGFLFIALCVGFLFIALSMVAFRIRRLMGRLEKTVDGVHEEVKDLVFDIRESSLFRMFVKRRRK